MEFIATVDQWPLVKGAAIIIQWVDYDGGGHPTIQSGDFFPVFFGNPLKRVANAKVVIFHHQDRAVLEFEDKSSWHIRRIQWHPTLQFAAGASASLWNFERPAT
jgi:hypothetical protein